MADITDPRAIKFVNEVIRPRAEQIRALKTEIDSNIIDWFAMQSTLIANDSSPIVDGRDAEGISRLVGSDVVNLINQIISIQGVLDQSGVSQVIAKPCVRPLQVN
jgi:hypothetical protein